MTPFVKIDPWPQGNPPVPNGVWPWLDLGTELSDPLLDDYLQLLQQAIPDAFATVELKQFRDAASLTEACYQAVVATRFSPTKIGAPSALPPVRVTVNSYASLDIPGSLGLPPNPIEPLLQYAVGMDLSAGSAENLFVNS
jgi:hypothetical protein